jgi:Ser/Thr protein kinase RdoA (MazF antagonist)
MSALFPTSKSVLAEGALAHLLEESYDLGGRIRCYLHLERWNDTYLVDSEKGRFILRVYRQGHRSVGEVQAEVDLLLHLRNAGLAVAAPVPRKEGMYLTTLSAAEGMRRAVLFTLAPGRPLDARDPASYTEDRARRIGELIGQIHEAADTCEGELERPRLDAGPLLERPLARVSPYFESRPQEIAWLRACAGRLANILLGLPMDAPAFGICHGDVQLTNVHFTEEGEPTIFDFDGSAHCWRAFDGATFLVNLCMFVPEEEGDRRETLWEAYREGYSRVRTPDEEETRAVTVLGAAHVIHSMGLCAGLRLNTGNYWIGGLLDQRLRFLKSWTEQLALD